MRAAVFPTCGMCIVYLVTLTSCGGDSLPPRYEVTGTVSYNGESVEGATLMFTPADGGGDVGVGKTDAQGKYKIEAIEGPQKVTIQKLENQGSGTDDNVDAADFSEETTATDPSPPKHLLPKKYIWVDSTDLQAEIKTSGENVFDFELSGSPAGVIADRSESEDESSEEGY